MIRNKVIYGNCKVLHPDGSLMFLCIEKRARWYLDRNLAVIVNEEPLTIQLTFEPQGRGASDRSGDEMQYHLGEKRNCCVICGSEDLETLTRHHVVPYEYRKFFPEEIKSRSSHDIVPICRKDHDVYENYYASALKRDLEKSIGLESPYLVHKNLSDMIKVQRYAKILMDPEKVIQIPDSRVSYFTKEIFRVFGKISLIEIVEINMKKYVRERMEEVARKVVEQMREDFEEIQKFSEMWRKHFIDSMNPQYLPEGWRVDHKLRKAQH